MKNFTIFALILALVVPVSAVHAAVPNQEDLILEVIENLENADSIEFEFDINLVAEYEDQYEDYNETMYFVYSGNVGYENLPANERSGYYDINWYMETGYDFKFDSQMSYIETPTHTYSKYSFAGSEGEWTKYPKMNSTEIEEIEDEYIEYVKMYAANGITITEQLQDQIFDGVVTDHYAYELNKEGILESLRESGDLSETELLEAEAFLMSQIQATGEIWIERYTHYPYKITSNIIIDSDEVAATIDAEIVFKSFNEKIRVEEPQDITIQTYEQPTIHYLPEPVEPAEPDADNDGLSDERELAYETDPHNPDTDGDGYLDGEEVDNYYNPNGPGMLDYDRDGLSDYDELYVYGTEFDDSDTDGDGYSDLVEVQNGYNPNGPGKM